MVKVFEIKGFFCYTRIRPQEDHMSVINDFTKNVSTFAKATTLGVLAMAATSCGGDKPGVEPQPPKKSGLTIVPISKAHLGGLDGRDGDLSVGIPDRDATLESVTVYTASNNAVSMDVSPSGTNKLSFMAESGKEITLSKRYDPNATTQNEYLANGAKGILAISQKGDSTLYQFSGEKILRTLSNEKYAKQLVLTATKGVSVNSRPQ
jgi:hypothetical protein